MYDAIYKLNEKYKETFGHRISFNDASLKYGGKFDNKGGGGKERLCHVSHRGGNDIDYK